jgi:hypothetical protein
MMKRLRADGDMQPNGDLAGNAVPAAKPQSARFPVSHIIGGGLMVPAELQAMKRLCSKNKK